MSITTDMGTESGISNFEASPCKLLPAFIQAAAFQQDGGGDNHGSTFSMTDFLFKTCLPVMGMLHVFSNASKDLYKVLGTWSDVYKSLKILEPLVTNKDRLRKFVFTSLVGTPHAPEIFNSCANHLYDKRWGEVFKFCRWLLSRLPVLRDTWDESKFKVGSPMAASSLTPHVYYLC